VTKNAQGLTYAVSKVNIIEFNIGHVRISGIPANSLHRDPSEATALERDASVALIAPQFLKGRIVLIAGD
jgi:hypothetical protein